MDKSYEKPVPREPKTAEKLAQLQIQNRRREYLERHPAYFENPEHELADPILFGRLVNKFQTPAERMADGQTKSYGLILEADLARGEAKMSKIKESMETLDQVIDANTGSFQDDPAVTKEEGQELWHDFLKKRFIDGGDEDFEYAQVDQNETYDVMERRDAEDAWFDQEEPRWENDTPIKQGETGIQDF